MGAPDLRKVGGSPIPWGCRSRAFTGLCHPGGRYSGLWVVSFVSPHRWVQVWCHRIIRCVMCRLWRGRWEAFFAGRDLAAATCRTYRQALGPLVEAVGADRPVTDLHADQVAAVFEELWAGRAPATWNTRRVAIQAFASWCGERWPLAGDLLVGVGPRRRRMDNTRAVPYEDLEELWRRRGVPLREKLLWRMLYETAARTSEVLALNVEDIDRARRRARIRSKGGSVDMVVWAAPTARLLGRYLAGRDTGPLFLTRWRTRTAPPRGCVRAYGSGRTSIRPRNPPQRPHRGRKP